MSGKGKPVIQEKIKNYIDNELKKENNTLEKILAHLKTQGIDVPESYDNVKDVVKQLASNWKLIANRTKPSEDGKAKFKLYIDTFGIKPSETQMTKYGYNKKDLGIPEDSNPDVDEDDPPPTTATTPEKPAEKPKDEPKGQVQQPETKTEDKPPPDTEEQKNRKKSKKPAFNRTDVKEKLEAIDKTDQTHVNKLQAKEDVEKIEDKGDKKLNHKEYHYEEPKGKFEAWWAKHHNLDAVIDRKNKVSYETNDSKVNAYFKKKGW